MHTDAPMGYVENYYEQDIARWDGFPDVTDLIDRTLELVKGPVVLNAGCGPQFYDYLCKFGQPPKVCLGIDIGPATIDFLKTSKHPRLVSAKNRAMAQGVEVDLVCADIFSTKQTIAQRFDTVVATGFIGTFHDDRLDALIDLFHSALRPGGQLIKMTWHGPHRTPEQTAMKLKYGYDSLKEHEPATLRAQIESRGFKTLSEELFACDPETYRWDVIQACHFGKTG